MVKEKLPKSSRISVLLGLGSVQIIKGTPQLLLRGALSLTCENRRKVFLMKNHKSNHTRPYQKATAHTISIRGRS
jgi:hypothetical protein